MAPKRKAGAVAAKYSDPQGSKANERSAEAVHKKPKISPSESTANGAPSDKTPFINRLFYPSEMSNERCERYNNNEIPRPCHQLNEKIKETKPARDKIEAGNAVLFWFKRDLRLFDNRGLALAAGLAKTSRVPLICLFIVSPQDYEAHFTSPARVLFELRTLHVIQKDLSDLDIPLIVETVEKRNNVPIFILNLCKQHQIKHVFCNIEYEVDESRRESNLIDSCLQQDISFIPVHDDVIVQPGELATGTGKQYAVYSPWFRTWKKYVHDHPDALAPSEKPGKNPPGTRNSFKHLFHSSIPSAPANKKLSPSDQKRLAHLWPAGEHEAMARLQKFTKEKITDYANSRNLPAGSHTAMLSVHHSAGTLSPRTSVRAARDANSSQSLESGKAGVISWISEVAWRDFYKHVLAHWPYICMFKPFKYEYSNIEWEYNDEHFEKWCQGMTGVPIVDAAMRQLNNMGYMHNRCRMIVASFLAKDLLLDWRMGEKYFMEHLIDGDFASNNGGWGFSASTGVDPQPYFRIFNPLLQSEKFDSDGEYIRQWVSELRDVKGKVIHDPYRRGAESIAKKNGYPKPLVEHSQCRDRALARYKAGIGRDTA